MTWRPNLWTPTRGKTLLRWLPDAEFEALAKKHGIPKHKDGFALWGRWWKKHDEIYVRANKLGTVLLHEIRHVDTQSNFHDGENHE